MKCHRDTCRNYAQIYQTKLTSKKPPPDIDQQLAEHEHKLDIFNLVIIRQQIEMEVSFSFCICVQIKLNLRKLLMFLYNITN